MDMDGPRMRYEAEIGEMMKKKMLASRRVLCLCVCESNVIMGKKVWSCWKEFTLIHDPQSPQKRL
jgi:hypothetical protein